MPPEEVSLELRARRDEEKRRALSRIEPLDLSGTDWHEPPHPDAVNAATFALRRALNAYPDPSAAPLREALAERHGVAAEQVALGHGAGELLRAACAALLAGGGDALVAWPGWQPLPGLVEAAGGRAVPVPPDRRPSPRARRRRDPRGARSPRPRDPTGATLRAAARARPLRARAGRRRPSWSTRRSASSRPTARTPRRSSPSCRTCSSCGRSPRRTRWRGCAPARRSARRAGRAARAERRHRARPPRPPSPGRSRRAAPRSRPAGARPRDARTSGSRPRSPARPSRRRRAPCRSRGCRRATEDGPAIAARLAAAQVFVAPGPAVGGRAPRARRAARAGGGRPAAAALLAACGAAGVRAGAGERQRRH